MMRPVHMSAALFNVLFIIITIASSIAEPRENYFYNDGSNYGDVTGYDSSDDVSNDVTFNVLKRAGHKRYHDISSVHRMKSGPAVGAWYYMMGHSKISKRKPDHKDQGSESRPRTLVRVFDPRRALSRSDSRRATLYNLQDERNRNLQDRDGPSNTLHHNESGLDSMIPVMSGSSVVDWVPAAEYRTKQTAGKDLETSDIRTAGRGNTESRDNENNSETEIGEILVDLLLKNDH